MYVGRNYQVVEAFIDSLPDLTEVHRNEGQRATTLSVSDLEDALDRADMAIVQSGDEQDLTTARAGTRAALSRLEWAAADPCVAEAAYRAVVVLDTVSKETPLIAFMPFRRTWVNVPE